MKQLQTKPCIKCGSEESAIQYVPDDTVEEFMMCGKTIIITEENDYIQVMCNRCEYTWTQEPLKKDKR